MCVHKDDLRCNRCIRYKYTILLSNDYDSNAVTGAAERGAIVAAVAGTRANRSTGRCGAVLRRYGKLRGASAVGNSRGARPSMSAATSKVPRMAGVTK